MLSFCKRRGRGGGGTDTRRDASLYMSFSEMIQKELGTVVDSGNGNRVTKGQVSGNFFL